MIRSISIAVVLITFTLHSGYAQEGTGKHSAAADSSARVDIGHRDDRPPRLSQRGTDGDSARIHIGPRGGRYYFNADGKKVYVRRKTAKGSRSTGSSKAKTQNDTRPAGQDDRLQKKR
jgi:hypothetical protein